MKTPTIFQLFFIFALVFSTSAKAEKTYEDFVQCITRFSYNSIVISKVTYTPSNSSYTAVLESTLNNLRFSTPKTPKPLVIVTPVDESQIQTVIYCSKKYGVQMRIRGSGHDFEGLSYVSHLPFVLLDMSNLRSIEVDPVSATAWVQGGATLGELYYRIAEKSNTLGFPAGVWSTVGVSGLTGGGGYGTLRRKYGLAADNVLDARIMDVNGRILDRKSMGEDLFWAIRGGGISSFGVLLAWKLRLVAVPKVVTVFQVDKTLEQNGTEIVHRWQTVAPKLPKELEIRIAIRTIPKNSPFQEIKTVLNDDPSRHENSNTVRFRFISLFLGRIDELLPLMEKRFPELGLVKEDCEEVSYIQSVQLFSLFSLQDPLDALLNRTSFKIAFKAKSGFVDKPITRKGLNGIWKILLKEAPGVTNMIFTSYGGRMDEISEYATPFPHRNGTLFKMYMRVLMDRDTPKRLKWIRGLYDYLAPYSTKSPRTAYVNYNDLDLGVNNLYGNTSYAQASKWGKSYFKNNFDRLVQVKAKVDPSNFFRHEQSIPILC